MVLDLDLGTATTIGVSLVAPLISWGGSFLGLIIAGSLNFPVFKISWGGIGKSASGVAGAQIPPAWSFVQKQQF